MQFVAADRHNIKQPFFARWSFCSSRHAVAQVSREVERNRLAAAGNKLVVVLSGASATDLANLEISMAALKVPAKLLAASRTGIAIMITGTPDKDPVMG
jgi:glutamate 5-kinase